MDVEICRDGYKYNLHFEKGTNIGGLKKEKCIYESTGSKIIWKPDLDVFTDINIPKEYFTTMLKKQAVVNSGLKFKFIDEKEEFEEEYLYENGIVDYVKEISNGKNFTDIEYYELSTKGKDREDKPEYKLKAQVAFCFSNEVNMIEYYHNSSFLEYGGSPDKAVKNAFIYEIDKCLKQNGKYNKDESKINFSDVQDSLIIVINSFSTVTSYENQTKKSITNRFIQDALTSFLKHQLEVYFIENKVESEKISSQILVNKRSRESAEKTRINIKKKLGGNVDISNRVKKFVDCRTKDKTKRELYIVEGDSALGACKLGRDAQFQAIIPVRGKILNCLKAEYENIFKNDIIIDILRVLGCGVEIKSKYNKDLHTFDLSSLKWDKIIICTDADVDGFQIRTLILAMLYRLVPTLIYEGKVFIAESPLYEINSKKKAYFAYSDSEKSKIISKIMGKYTIQRSKGLGENEPDMMWQTTMNPETRRLIKVVPNDIELTNKFFDLFLGENLQGRKNYINEHGYKYIDKIEVV
jgi:DNA gyrase subunit B